jgi:hypothetical protein
MASLSPALEEREEELRQTLDNLERPEELASVCTGTQAQRIVQNLRALLGEFKAALLADEGQGQVQGQTDAGDATTTQRRLQRHAALRVRIHSLNGRYQGRLNEVRQAERRSLLAAASDLPAASGGSDGKGGGKGGGSAGLRQRVQATSAELGKSRDVTASLQRTRKLMAAELERAQNVSRVLDDGDAALNNVNTTYEKYGDEMKNAKGLLRTFRSNDQRERLYLALATFLGVVAYIVWRRLGSRIAALVGTFL